ncbi:MAG: hypothetical protein V1789_11370 [PVC group bacterium]
MRLNVILLAAPLVFMAAGPARGDEETPALLFGTARSLIEEARLQQAGGETEAARKKCETAAYLLEKISRDFPEWDPPAVKESLAACRAAAGMPASLPSPPGPETLTCLWKPLIAAADFEPEDGDVYRIAVAGNDRSRLRLSFTRLKPYAGEARICIHTMNTPSNMILLDQKNQGLFLSDGGEFTVSLAVPVGWPLYLAEDTDNLYATPVVLSNIVELP